MFEVCLIIILTYYFEKVLDVKCLVAELGRGFVAEFEFLVDWVNVQNFVFEVLLGELRKIR